MAMRLSVRAAVLCALFTLVIGLTLGLIAGYLLSTQPDSGQQQRLQLLQKMVRDAWSDDPVLTHRIIEMVDPERLKENLKFLSRDPHLAGTARDKELAIHIRDTWLRNGLDTSELVPYEVLLSYSSKKKPNKVQIVAEDGSILFTSEHKEETLRSDDAHKDFVHAFHAYSPSGTVTGDLVYLNCGHEADWEGLDEMNITLDGRIVLFREGCDTTGSKIKDAYERGAVGMLTFPDPQDVAPLGMDPKSVYPHSIWLPPTGILRSSALAETGDPLTPGYPAIEGAFRLPISQAQLPKIPSQPISYKDAGILLGWLGGEEAPEHWRGDLNLTYRVGPGFAEPFQDVKVRLTVNNQYRMVESFNVIGTIEGEIEPDRYILLGNHRDAWGFGALDPSSGTAVLLELSRVFGELHREGWRPRRTIVFCSWGAEEYGLIGSTEWVEEKLPKLRERAVTYINTDICVVGEKFTVMSSPVLNDALYDIAKLIPDPGFPEMALYDKWLADRPMKLKNGEVKPSIKRLEVMSDFAPFIFFAGIPSVDISWQDFENQTGSIYPVYHTGYETFYIVEKFVDPHFRRHQGCGRMAGVLMRYFADSAILPLNLKDMATAVKDEIHYWKSQQLFEMLEEGGVETGYLLSAAHNLTVAVDKWMIKFHNVDKSNPLMVRMLNDQMMLMEKAFVSAPRDPERWLWRHRHFSTPKYMLSLLNTIDQLDFDSPDRDLHWQEIQRHISELVIAIHQAIQILQPLNEI